MKLRNKIAVALVTATAALSAQAAIILPGTNDSEVIAVLYDTGSKSVFSFDTGILGSAFNTALNQSFDLAALTPLYAQWKPQTTGTIQFAVLAADGSGNAATAGSRSALFTTTAGTNPMGSTTNTQLNGATAAIGTTSMQTWSGMSNTGDPLAGGQANTHSVVGQANGAGYTFATSGLQSFGTFQNNWNGPLGLSMVNAGSSAEFFRAVTTGQSTARVSVTDFYKANETASNLGGYWTLSSAGTLNYQAAPVPEASEWAMMLAGLGLISLMVRRRSFSA